MTARKSAPAPLAVVAANLNKDLAGDVAYLAWLRSTIGLGILFLQERGHGIRSTRVVGVGVRVRRLPWWVVGRVGVHRGVARGRVHLDGVGVVRLFSLHALHRRTSGPAAQAAFYRRVARRFDRLNRRGVRWVMGVDANLDVDAVAELLGGTCVKAAGIVGVIVGPGLECDRRKVYTTPKLRGWSDHVAIRTNVRASA